MCILETYCAQDVNVADEPKRVRRTVYIACVYNLRNSFNSYRNVLLWKFRRINVLWYYNIKTDGREIWFELDSARLG